jgi:hypothetical protein
MADDLGSDANPHRLANQAEILNFIYYFQLVKPQPPGHWRHYSYLAFDNKNIGKINTKPLLIFLYDV